MLKLTALFLTRTSRIRIGVIGCHSHGFWFSTIRNPPAPAPAPTPTPTPTQSNNTKDPKVLQTSNHTKQVQTSNDPRNTITNELPPKPFGRKLSRIEKNSILIRTLLDLGDSKDAVYGALDAWVAWEQNFPICSLKYVLATLEKKQQWHRVVQVIKWMLSKGQGNTIGTYQQLIQALDMDHRAEEAHNFWMKKIGNDLHSVPWQACHLMISVYLRNAMLDHLVKLFKRLEAFGRKPPDKLIVQKVADAYDLLDLIEDKERLLEKYDALLNRKTQQGDKSNKKSKKLKPKRKRTVSGSSRSVANAQEVRKCGTRTQQNA